MNDFELTTFVYPDLACDARTFEKRVILAMTNVGIDGINDSIPQPLSGRMHTLFSHDIIQGGSDLYTMPTHLHAVNIPEALPHELHLKVGAMVTFIRNLNFNTNAINGCKGVITAIYRNLIEEILFVE